MKKRYIFIFILLSIFVMPLNSKAATVAQRSDGVTTFFDGGTTFPFAKWGNDVSIALYVYNYMVDLSYNYYIFEMCANSVPYARISNGGYNSYFSESNIVTYSTNQSCTYGGYNGSVFYIQLKVAKWGASDDGGEVMVSSTLRLSYDVTWKPYSYITDYYLSTDDVLTEFVQNSKVDKDLNSILNAQNSTNSKLDGTNSKLDSTNSKLDSTNTKLDEANETSKGIFGKIKEIFTAIGELPSKLVNLMIDMFKSLLVPTDEQLYDVIEDSKELSQNFGFVGESIAFFLDIFTSLLGLVNANGCIELPEFTVGATSLFDSFTFWEAQNVCLADNAILSTHIETIRVVTSIAFISMFISWASSKFFSILSKNDYNNSSGGEDT